MNDLKPGDAVHLNSGGPVMTLETITSGKRVIARCTWFDGSQKHSENFVLTSLKHYKAAQPAQPAQPIISMVKTSNGL